MYTQTLRRLGIGALAVVLAVLWTAAIAPIVHAQCEQQGYHYCPSANACIPLDTICILEPVPGGPTTIEPGTDVFATYIWNGSGSGLWDWALELGIGIAVLNCTIGGFQIVFSNGDQGAVDNGKTRFMWATLGLAMLFLAGTILAFINPEGFTTS